MTTQGLLAAIFVGVALGALACGGGGAQPVSQADGEADRTNDRPRAADFTVSTGPGSSFSLDDHMGEVVVLYFSFPG